MAVCVWGCVGFVTRGRSKGNAQFIEAGHGCSEFERKETYCGIEMSHRSLPNVALTEGKVLGVIGCLTRPTVM
jgi:hypothetical protein